MARARVWEERNFSICWERGRSQYCQGGRITKYMECSEFCAQTSDLKCGYRAAT